jgi:phosphohistidine phosphatase SixA
VLGYGDGIEPSESLTPDGSAADVWEEIRAHKTETAILLASHEPLMSATVAYLLGSPGVHVDMKKASLVRIDVDRFGPHPLGVLKWMLVPGVC